MPLYIKVVIERENMKFYYGDGIKNAHLLVKNEKGEIVFEFDNLQDFSEIELKLNPGKYDYIFKMSNNEEYKGRVVVPG